MEGCATDGSLDWDEQVVSPQFSGAAIKAWLDQGGPVRLGHDPRQPVGKGISCYTDEKGATFVRSLIVSKRAKKLIKAGILRAYSVGLSRPVIERDVTGKARGGIITSAVVTEVSVVDSPSNRSCFFRLVKSRGGVPVYSGKTFGVPKEIRKALKTPVTDPVRIQLEKSLSSSDPAVREVARNLLGR